MKQLAVAMLATVALLSVGACQSKTGTPTSIPIPTPMLGVPPITDFTPLAGLTKVTEVRDRYFEAVSLWKVPAGRAYTPEDTLIRAETFTLQDKQIGLHIDTLGSFVPGMLIAYRVDGRGSGGGSKEVSLASTITTPGTYEVILDAPTRTGSYVLRFFLNGILVDNLLFEMT